MLGYIEFLQKLQGLDDMSYRSRLSEVRRLELEAFEEARQTTEENKEQNKHRDEEIRKDAFLDQIKQLEFEALQNANKAPEAFKLNQAKQAIDREVLSSLQSVKDDIKMAKMPRGRIVRFFLCDVCGDTIPKPTSDVASHEGFIIQGNVWLADPDANVGLIGNNIPQNDDKLVDVKNIKKTVICRGCLMKALGIDKTTPLKRSVFIDKVKQPDIQCTNSDVPF